VCIYYNQKIYLWPANLFILSYSCSDHFKIIFVLSINYKEVRLYGINIYDRLVPNFTVSYNNIKKIKIYFKVLWNIYSTFIVECLLCLWQSGYAIDILLFILKALEKNPNFLCAWVYKIVKIR